jgi:MFS family permease
VPAQRVATSPIPIRLGPHRLPAALQSLRHRNYRLLWFGTIVSNSGDWIYQIALNWLVYQLSGSAVQLALLNLCRLAPIFVFTLVGGVVADRMERRRLLFVTQLVAMLLAVVLATLTIVNLVQIWMVLLIAIGRGVVLSFNQPARQSLISELVPRDDLKNAIALNSATLNLTRVLGPTIGARAHRYGRRRERVLSERGELPGGAVRARVDAFPGPRAARQQGQHAVRAGKRVQLSRSPRHAAHAGGSGACAVRAGHAVHDHADGLCQRRAAGRRRRAGPAHGVSGVGAVSGALWVASQAHRVRLGRLMLVGMLCFGASLLVFSLSGWFWLSFAALLAVGASQQIYMASNNALIQTSVEEEYRGRVLSTLFLNRGMVPLGTMIAGIGTALFGVQATMASMGGALLVLAVLVVRFAPAAREID